MVVRCSKYPAMLGRLGAIICAASDAMDSSHPEDFTEVIRRDWVVELQGGPDVYFRGDGVVLTNRLAMKDICLMPIRPGQCEEFAEALEAHHAD